MDKTALLSKIAELRKAVNHAEGKASAKGKGGKGRGKGKGNAAGKGGRGARNLTYVRESPKHNLENSVKEGSPSASAAAARPQLTRAKQETSKTFNRVWKSNPSNPETEPSTVPLSTSSASRVIQKPVHRSLLKRDNIRFSGNHVTVSKGGKGKGNPVAKGMKGSKGGKGIKGNKGGKGGKGKGGKGRGRYSLQSLRSVWRGSGWLAMGSTLRKWLPSAMYASSTKRGNTAVPRQPRKTGLFSRIMLQKLQSASRGKFNKSRSGNQLVRKDPTKIDGIQKINSSSMTWQRSGAAADSVTVSAPLRFVAARGGVKVGKSTFKVSKTGKTLERVKAAKEDGPPRAERTVARHTPRRLLIGGRTFVSKGDLLVRDSNEAKKTIASRTKKRSLTYVRKKMKKSKEPCMFFCKFGKCSKLAEGSCP